MRVCFASAIVAVALGVSAAAASAETDRFVYSGGDPTVIFQLPASPTLADFTDGAAFDVANVDVSIGGVASTQTVSFYNTNLGGMFAIDGEYAIQGPQVYTGDESAPTFKTGVYSGTNFFTGQGGTLTITAVPEPATWTMMLVGVGALGMVARSRRKVAIASV